MKIQPNHEKLSYTGRIDWSRQEEPVFIFPCTSVCMRFTGTMLKIHVKNRRAYWDNYLGCILDGKQTALLLPQEGEAVLDVFVERRDIEEHEVLIFKRQDSCHEVSFLGAEIEDGAKLLDAPKKPYRKIEVYGDSVSAGEVAEAVEYTGCEDPEHNGEYSNSWYSYAWMTARKLNAQIHDIAQGGIALMNHTGWFCEPQYIGMESVWDKVRYYPEFGKPQEWDFENYTPQIVIVAVGQNDSNPEDYMKEDYSGEKAENWRQHYRVFLSRLREKYPHAQIVCCTTLLCHDRSWDISIGQAVRELGDEKVTQYIFKRNGEGTPGHLRIPEAEEMAQELSDYISKLEIEGWNDNDAEGK